MKKKKLLVVVDMQNDFVTGSLGTKEAQTIIPNVVNKIKAYQKNEDYIFVTKDCHYGDYLNTLEGQYLPIKHCLFGTWGFNLVPDVKDQLDKSDYVLLEKETFGSIELIKQNSFPNIKVFINTSCTSATSKKAFDATKVLMKSLQIEEINE